MVARLLGVVAVAHDDGVYKGIDKLPGARRYYSPTKPHFYLKSLDKTQHPPRDFNKNWPWAIPPRCRTTFGNFIAPGRLRQPDQCRHQWRPGDVVM